MFGDMFGLKLARWRRQKAIRAPSDLLAPAQCCGPRGEGACLWGHRPCVWGPRAVHQGSGPHKACDLRLAQQLWTLGLTKAGFRVAAGDMHSIAQLFSHLWSRSMPRNPYATALGGIRSQPLSRFAGRLSDSGLLVLPVAALLSIVFSCSVVVCLVAMYRPKRSKNLDSQFEPVRHRLSVATPSLRAGWACLPTTASLAAAGRHKAPEDLVGEARGIGEWEFHWLSHDKTIFQLFIWFNLFNLDEIAKNEYLLLYVGRYYDIFLNSFFEILEEYCNVKIDSLKGMILWLE